MTVILVVLTIINLILYHKIFKVYYFNLGYALIGEIIGAVLVAVAEIFLFSWLISGIGAVVVGIGTVLLYVLLGVLGIGVVYFVVKAVRRLIRKKKGVNPAQSDSDVESAEAQEKSSPYTEDISYGESTSENIKETYSKSGEKIQTKEEKVVQEELVIIEAEQDKSYMFCVYCGKKIPRNVKFCSYCGEVTVIRNTRNEDVL